MLYMYKNKNCDHKLDFVSNERRNLVSEIIRNTEASTYFIEQIDFDNVLEPYIIDLTEPISIPFEVAKRLLSGIKKKEIEMTRLTNILLYIKTKYHIFLC